MGLVRLDQVLSLPTGAVERVQGGDELGHWSAVFLSFGTGWESLGTSLRGRLATSLFRYQPR